MLSHYVFSLLPLALLSIIIIGCADKPPGPDIELDFTIPAQSDWVDYGTIFEAGKEGEWDHLLWGGFTATVMKKDGTYYLYYQGASEYLGAPYDTVVWRAIGVATSQDGVSFTKYDGNPVVTWFPSGIPEGNGEEGAVSGGVTLDANGDIALYYGANTAFSATKVHADGRLAISEDGFQFTDVGSVLEYNDSSLWGSGDELFPIAAIHDAGQWIVYYLPNGGGNRRNLGVAWGDARDDLRNSAAARSGLAKISAWGTAGKAKVGPKIYAIFTNWVTDPRTEVRLVSLDAPDKFSNLLEVYRFDDVSQATVILDEESRTWFMYYRGPERYGVKLAPAGPVDITPPTTPVNISAVTVSDSQIDLSWKPAVDAETGIFQYKLFRNGDYLTTVKGLEFSDTDLVEATAYTYSISAVNLHGVEGPQSTAITITRLKRAESSKTHFIP
jgi:hypothetical protein